MKDREMDDDGERSLGNLLVPGFLEMLNEIARELGQVEFAKAAEDQRIRLLLDALRSTQTLLILDNLESLPKSDRDQLFTFVKRLPQACEAKRRSWSSRLNSKANGSTRIARSDSGKNPWNFNYKLQVDRL